MSSHPFFSCFVPVFRVTEVSSPSLFTLFLFPEWQRSAHQVWSLCSCFQCNKGSQPSLFTLFLFTEWQRSATQFVHFVLISTVTKVILPSLFPWFQKVYEDQHNQLVSPLSLESIQSLVYWVCLFVSRKLTKKSPSGLYKICATVWTRRTSSPARWCHRSDEYFPWIRVGWDGGGVVVFAVGFWTTSAEIEVSGYCTDKSG